MKKFFLNILALVCVAPLFFQCGTNNGPVPIPTDTTSVITIASFNALHLGWDNGKDLNILADVLKSYDVIGLQEVMQEDTLKKLGGILNQKTGVTWEYIISNKLGRSSYKEHYAVLYRNDRTTCTANTTEIWNDVGDQFEREPFYASFKSGNFDYTLIIMHTDFDSNKEVMRKEARLLKNVFNAIQNQDSKEDDIILMGDFNLSADDAGWNDLKSISTVTNLIAGSTLTTISTSGSLSSAYDNIWIQAQYTNNEYASIAASNQYYTTLFAGTSNPGLEARIKISDHIPVYARFYIKKEDDD